MKKLLAIILVICIGSSLFIAAALEEKNEVAEKVANTLVGCEVILEENLQNTNETLKRKEAVQTLIRLLAMESIVDTMQKDSPFLDVQANDPYAPYIILGSEIGLVGGDGNGYFRPEDLLSQDEATKLLLAVLGYDEAAQAEGGYPAGYHKIAQNLSLFRDVPLGAEYTEAAFYTMVYNAMQKRALVSRYNGTAQPDDETFGMRLMEQKNIITGDGIVYGNAQYSLLEDMSLKSERVRIGEETFLLGDFELPTILGRNVTYYAKLNDHDEYVLTHVFKVRRSSELVIAEEDEPFWRQGEIGHYNQSGREQTENLSDTCIYIYNGRPAELPLEGDINGEVMLIDHEGDGQYDLVIVNETETRRISYINANKGIINFKREPWYSEEEMPQGLKELNEADEGRVILLENSDGESIALTDLSVEDVVTIMVSIDGKHVYIQKEENTIEGSVTSLSEAHIGVDGEEYELEQKNRGEEPFGIGRLGETGTFYLNGQNQVIYFTEDTDLPYSYGYIADVAVLGGLNSEVSVKLITPGRIKYFEETYDDGTTEKYLKAANEAVEVHYLKEKLTFDGVREESVSLVENGIIKKGMVIRYEQNNEGVIRKIDLPIAYYDADSRSQMRKFVTFGDGKAVKDEDKTVFAFSGINKGGFKVSSTETAVFCVPPLEGEEQTITGDPNYAIQSDDDYFDNITMNNGTSYYTRAFDFEEDTSIVRVFMIVSGLNANRSDDVLISEPWSILQSKRVKIDENGDVVYNLIGYSEGKNFNVQSMSGDANGLSRQLEDLLAGDVFKFTTNTRGRIYELSSREDIYSIAAETPDAGDGFYSRDVGNLYGKVSRIERKIIDESTTQYAHVIDVDYGDGIETITASYTDTAIYSYDTKRKEVEMATEDEIYSYEETGSESCTMIFAKVDAARNAEIIVIVD